MTARPPPPGRSVPPQQAYPQQAYPQQAYPQQPYPLLVVGGIMWGVRRGNARQAGVA